jgi:tetratricopeptide (TPR) repeat protein
MSLLLDALKKAAEQKAENNRGPEADLKSSDETLSPDQVTTKVSSDSETTGQHAWTDGSQPDSSATDIENREGAEQILADDEESIAGRSREDKTQIVSDDETIDFNDDKTQLVSEDETQEFSYDDLATFKGDGASTDPESDDIDRTSLDDHGDAETIFSDSDVTDEPVDVDSSDSRFEPMDTVASNVTGGQVDTLPRGNEPDPTLTGDPARSLNLVDMPGSDDTTDKAGRIDTADGSTTAPASEYFAQPGGENSTLLDSTSTRTFAPDNYDRTLHKPLDDGATSLFAGLKSDGDVVMTPEYAKKMFVNKSSSLRMQNFRIYGGTALGILLVIAIFGAFEIESHSTDIDSKLRPLKRDPMPGLIKILPTENFTNVLAPVPGNEVDASTLKLIENAELIVETEEIVAIESGAEDEIQVENMDADQIESDAIVTVEEKQAPIAVAMPETNPVKNISLAVGSEIEPAATDTIKIISKNTITEKDRWLHEAYAAYLRGDDQLALVKYNAVLDIDPDNRNALLARAAISIQNNRVTEAIGDYRRILFTNPKDSLAMSSMIAVANFSPEQSETQLKLLIRDEPDSHYLNFTLGNIFGAQNRWQEAQRKYFAALQNNPDDPNYAYNLAVSLEHIAKPKVAIAYYELALNNYTRGLATFNRDVVDARLEMLKQL